MGRICSTLFAVLILTIGLSAKPALPDRIIQSIVGINYTNAEGHALFCTGTTVATGVVTARHCLGDNITVDDEASAVIKVSGQLALLRPTSHKPALDIRTKPLRLGDHLLSFGYAFGFMEVLTRNVSRLWDAGLSVSVDAPFGQGMSGGPTVDMDGKLVGIIQASNELTGIISGQVELMEFVK